MPLLWHSLECKGYFRIAVVESSYSCQWLHLKFAINGIICAGNILTMGLRVGF